MSGIGHNSPPPFEAHSIHIEDLFDEAQNFLDGAKVETQDQADAIGKLLDMLRQSKKAADGQRAIEKRPHDEAAKAVQAKWKPLIDKCELAANIAKKALEPFLEAKEAANRAAAAAARAEAERLAEEARQAAAQVRADDLAAQAQIEEQRKAVAAAERAANRADKVRANVAGGAKAITLRTNYSAEITDMTAFARWAWAHRKSEVEAFFHDLAAREVRTSQAPMPGVLIHTERKAA